MSYVITKYCLAVDFFPKNRRNRLGQRIDTREWCNYSRDLSRRFIQLKYILTVARRSCALALFFRRREKEFSQARRSNPTHWRWFPARGEQQGKRGKRIRGWKPTRKGRPSKARVASPLSLWKIVCVCVRSSYVFARICMCMRVLVCIHRVNTCLYSCGLYVYLRMYVRIFSICGTYAGSQELIIRTRTTELYFGATCATLPTQRRVD